MTKIKIRAGKVSIRAQLLDTPTARAIAAALPIESKTQTWGEEIYFATKVLSELEPDAREVVQAGEIAFWVQGQSIAIGFGPTPISKDGEIRLATKTNIWANALDDVACLSSVKDGDGIRVELDGS